MIQVTEQVLEGLIAKQAEKILDKMKEVYKGNRDEFDFQAAYFAGGEHNKKLRQEMIRNVTGRILPIAKCTIFKLTDILKTKFDQLDLFKN